MLPSMVVSPKAIDIFIEGYRHAIRTVEASLTIALTAAAVVYIWGIQGDFDNDLLSQRRFIEAAPSSNAASAPGRVGSASPLPTAVPRSEVEVPVLRFKAELSRAAGVCLLIYVAFTVRAANHLKKARTIALKLRQLDGPVLEALLMAPSIASSSALAKASVAFLGGMLAAGAYSSLLKAMQHLMPPPFAPTSLEIFVGAASLLLLSVYLAWQLVVWQRAPLGPENAA